MTHTFRVIPSSLQPADPAAHAEGLTVSNEGRIVLNAAGAAIELRLRPYDAAVVGGTLLKFAINHAGLEETPAAGEA